MKPGGELKSATARQTTPNMCRVPRWHRWYRQKMTCTGALCLPKAQPKAKSNVKSEAKPRPRITFANDFVTTTTCSSPVSARRNVLNQGTDASGIRITYRHPDITPQTMWKMACVLRSMGINVKTYLSTGSSLYRRGDPRNLTIVTPRTEENLKKLASRLEGDQAQRGTVARLMWGAASFASGKSTEANGCISAMKKSLHPHEMHHAKSFCSLVTKSIKAHIPGFMDKYGGYIWGGAVTGVVFGTLMVIGWWWQKRQKHKHEGDDMCTVKVHIDNYHHYDVHLPCGGWPGDVKVPNYGGERYRPPIGQFKPHRYGYRRPLFDPLTTMMGGLTALATRPRYTSWHDWSRYNGSASASSASSSSGSLSTLDKIGLLLFGAAMLGTGMYGTNVMLRGGGPGLSHSPAGFGGVSYGPSIDGYSPRNGGAI